MAKSKRPLATIDDIDAGKAAVEQKIAPDTKDAQEKDRLALAKTAAGIKALEEQNEDKAGNRRLRADYAKKVYYYLCAYSLACLLLLILSGWKILGFELPWQVLSLLVGSTAVAAIGLVGFVVNGLFKSPLR